MANTREVLTDRFFIVSGVGRRQTAQGVPLTNAHLDTRDKCTVTREEVVVRRDYRDCRDVYITNSKIETRMARYTLDYAELTPQIIARWTAYKEGAAAAPVGAPAIETQTLTVSGPGTLSLTLEGRTVTTKTIPADATAAQIEAALTAARMLFIEPGDVVVTGAGPFTLTFPAAGNLGHANLPLFVGTGGMVVTPGTDGAQRHHEFARSSNRQKAHLSFALGWDTVTDRVEKYADYVVDSVTTNLNRDTDVAMQVVLLGPWEYDSIETAFPIPNCVNIDPLQTKDCRIELAGLWQTTDINTLAAPINDAVPVDRLSAFPFDGIDVQTLERGRQPVDGPVTISLLGSEADPIYQRAQNERTEPPGPVNVHFGFPGNRCSWYFANSEFRFQTNRMGEAGDARYALVNIEAVPESVGGLAPFDADAYVNQATAFLST